MSDYEAGGGKRDDPDDDVLRLETHRDFARAQPEIFRRLNANPEIAHLMLVNPVLALKDVRVELSQELKHHVLHTLLLPPDLRQRREELEAALTEALGEPPHPDDPAWNSRLLFEKLQLAPLDLGDRQPVYKLLIAPSMTRRAAAIRKRWEAVEDSDDPRRQRPSGASAMKIRLPEPRNKARRLDLDAVPPDDIPEARTPPDSVPLESLFFYKDRHPLVRDVLELGIIQTRGFPIQSADMYRRIKAGEATSPFTKWVRTAHFPLPDPPDRPPDQRVKGEDDEPDR